MSRPKTSDKASKFSLSARPITDYERASLDVIWNIVADEFQVPLEVVSSPRRFGAWAQPRMVFMYMAKIYTPIGLKQIGQYCGNRDHATVIHGQQAASDMEDTDKRMRAKIAAIRAKLDATAISHAHIDKPTRIITEKFWQSEGYL